MIIETRGDVVRLSGSLHKNQWMTIRAAANLLLHDHPQGIIVDCSDLEEVSEEGAKTFLEAIRDIEAARARILVANLPANVLTVLKTVPGVRSQLPIAASVEAARASLQMQKRGSAASEAIRRGQNAAGGQIIVVPLLEGADLSYGADLGARIARATRGELRLVYLLEVTRTLPLNAPLMEQEQAAQDTLTKALQLTRQYGVPASEHVERVRDAVDGALVVLKTYNASQVVVGAAHHDTTHGDHDRFDALVDTLLHRASCEVIIGRLGREPENKA